MKFSTLLGFFAFPAVLRAATITIFGLAPEETGSTTGTTPTLSIPTGSETIRAVGVGADGATTYVQELVWSVFLESHESEGLTTTVSFPTSTVTGPPHTIHSTLVADATHYFYNISLHADLHEDSEVDGNEIENCDLDNKGGMSCVFSAERFGLNIFTTTITGHAVPIYTLVTVDDAPGGSTKDNSATKPGFHLLVAGIVVGGGVIAGFIMGI